MARPCLLGLVLACSLTMVGCQATPQALPGVPRSRLQPVAHRVVVLSVDGLAADHHLRLLARDAYKDEAGLLAFERWGYVVERAIPTEPSLTAAVHAAIATGAPPAVNGIVSNRFHLPSAPIWEGVSGFEADWEAESFWHAFRRQGKRVGILTYPGSHGSDEERRGDFGMNYVTSSFARAASVTLEAADFQPAPGQLPEGAASYSAPRAASLAVTLEIDDVESHASFPLIAVDTLDDGITAYDTVLADHDADAATDALAVHTGEWFPLQALRPHPDGGERLVGAWCLLQRLAGDLAEVLIYRGGFHATDAYPRAFRETLQAEAGFWPGSADDRHLEDEGLRVSEYIDQVRRFSAFFSACARAAVATESFDLLLAYQPVVDEVQHAFTIVDPRQAAYSEGLAATAARIIDDVYLIADQAVADLARTLDLSRDAFVVVSDHGIAPIWEVVYVNEILRRAGLLNGEEHNGRWRIAADSSIVAFASGGCAHLYVNLVGREPTGVVSPEQRDELIRQAAQALARAEVGGEPVVEAIYRREDLAEVGLDTPRAGDLVVFLKPGFAATSWLGGATHEPADYFGQHGYLSHHSSMHGVWLARGAAVPRSRVKKAPLTKVAAFVSRLAGVAPPAQAEPWP